MLKSSLEGTSVIVQEVYLVPQWERGRLLKTCTHYSLIKNRLFHLVIEFLETKKRRSKWTKGSFEVYKAFFDEVRSYLLVNGGSRSACVFEILGQM